MTKGEIITELTEIGESLMQELREDFPPQNFPTLDELIEQMEESGMPWGDDAFFSCCLVNALKIQALIEKIEEVQK